MKGACFASLRAVAEHFAREYHLAWNHHSSLSGRIVINKRKNGDFAALRRLSPDGEELDGGGRVLGSFILRSAQQEEALHRIWYALRRWRLVSRRIVLFLTTACSSINRR
ncbi:unnamed protein product [Spirodela intermedia]|uniref:Uncharacterized protein n=1 Tax=Spirodela intermedia TaxID=51605 RepID=A0A7I8JDQ6_SPIIN|nr:unnamed protein product [Spirodela intermedia]CAA6667512.1 unnamed protein product [Spirodela intermedia]